MITCNKSTILTSTGKLVDLNDVKLNDIDIEDMINCLSNQYRFHGNMRWSVAAHSYFVYRLRHFAFDFDGMMAMPAFIGQYLLTHDCHEAYTGDIISPFKNAAGINDIVEKIQSPIDIAIHTYLSLPPIDEESINIVKKCDKVALAIELTYMCRKAGWMSPHIDDLRKATLSPEIYEDVTYRKYIKFFNMDFEKENDCFTNLFAKQLRLIACDKFKGNDRGNKDE